MKTIFLDHIGNYSRESFCEINAEDFLNLMGSLVIIRGEVRFAD